MQVFVLAVLTAQSTHVPVLTKAGTLEYGEELPRQNSTQVFLVPN